MRNKEEEEKKFLFKLVHPTACNMLKCQYKQTDKKNSSYKIEASLQVSI